MKQVGGMVADPIPSQADDVYSSVAGALIGAASADALGWITEFVRGREHLEKLYGSDRVTHYRPWQKTSGGRFNAYVDHINKGEYSDDTQLGLCMARSVRSDGSIDLEHFSKRELPLWLDYARGAGSTITAAARAISRKSARWNSNFFGYRHRGKGAVYVDAGANGAAMRIGPLALANLERPQELVGHVVKSAIVTHGHPRAILGAVILAEALRRTCQYRSGRTIEALVGELIEFVEDVPFPRTPDLKEWKEKWNRESQGSFDQSWEATRKEALDSLHSVMGTGRSANSVTKQLKTLGCFERATRGSGIATVMAALLIFRVLGESHESAVTFAVNQLGTDTDTIGGFVGGLCGAYHGYAANPSDWAGQLQDYDYFLRVAAEVSRVATGLDGGGQSLLPEATGEVRSLPNLLTLLRAREVNADERVFHPLFGTGWVESVEAQNLRRKGAKAVFARVRFDIGQSCKFRFLRMPQSHRTVHGRTPTQ
jgi:ADP-ribosylglycohydrolase